MLLIISAVTSLFGAPYIYMTPVFARDIFHLGETGLAVLMGMAGAGALFGALFLAYLGDFRRKGWLVLGGDLAFAVCLIWFFAVHALWLCRWSFFSRWALASSVQSRSPIRCCKSW